MPGPGTAAMISAAVRKSWNLAPSMERSVHRLMRPCQTERHHLLQRRLHRRGREQRQRVDRHRAVVLGAVDGVFQRAVLGHEPDGMIEIAVLDLAALQRPDPERALAV